MVEVLIILVVISIIGYVIYQALPNTKYEKVSKLIEEGKLQDACNILHEIFLIHAEAPIKLAECKLKAGQLANNQKDVAIKYFNEIFEIKKMAPNNIASKPEFTILEAKAYLEIAKIKFTNSIVLSNVTNKVSNLKQNLVYIDNSLQLGFKNEFISLRKQHCLELAEIHLHFGIQNEISLNLTEAIQYYTIAKEYSIQSLNSEIFSMVITRKGICTMKTNGQIDQNILEEVNKAPLEYKRDFFYRYAIKLLQQKEYRKAENIITAHLNFSAPVIDILKERLKNNKIRNTIRYVTDINHKIEQLYENSFPIEDVKALFETIEIQIEENKSLVPAFSYKLQAIKPSLFNRLLSNYISSKLYSDALDLIQKYSSFYENSELLKNLGICCCGLVTKENLTETNYKIVISSWLTSIFSDKVILKSLDATSWDDKYTFTLIDTIGSNFKHYDKIPDNTNYDYVSDTNISIGATQRELLQQFESLLYKTISDTNFSKIVHEFYDNEKEAIEKIISIINKDVLFVAPHFAKIYGLNEEIIKELDNYYVKHLNEESLEAGIPYLNAYSNTYVNEFETARVTVSTMVSAIRNENLSELKSLATDKKRSLVEKYKTINDSLEDSLFNAFTLKIEENYKNENLITLMEECILMIKNNGKLKTLYATFIHNFCEANWKTKPAINLFELLIKSIKANPDNYRVAKLLTVSINNNLMEIANDETTSIAKIYSLIENVKMIRSEALKDALKELLLLREKVLVSLGADTTRTISGGHNLNSSLMKLKKVLETMQSLGNG